MAFHEQITARIYTEVTAAHVLPNSLQALFNGQAANAATAPRPAPITALPEPRLTEDRLFARLRQLEEAAAQLRAAEAAAKAERKTRPPVFHRLSRGFFGAGVAVA